jgi:hypothetical protein
MQALFDDGHRDIDHGSHAAALRDGSVGLADARQCLFEVCDQIVDVFDAGRIAHQPLRDTGGGALLGAALDMTGHRRRTDDGLDTA